MYFIVLADAMFCICVCGRYARKYLSNVEPELIAEFQEAMALLAFSLDTKCMKYRVSGGKLIHWSESRGRKDVGWTVGLRLWGLWRREVGWTVHGMWESRRLF